MIDPLVFAALRQEISAAEEQREHAILCSRQIIHLSKQIIYALHRHHEVGDLVTEMRQYFLSLPSFADSHVHVAAQEYVEALTYVAFVCQQSLPSFQELGVRAEDYVAGLCDLSGELVRRAVSCATAGDISSVETLFSFVSSLYAELLQLSVRGDLRKKIDMVRWNLQKLEDLLFSLRHR